LKKLRTFSVNVSCCFFFPYIPAFQALRVQQQLVQAVKKTDTLE
jgi:hypothetical protein